MKAIVATDKLWGIGKNNKLLFHIKEDMEFFKEMTTDKIVVMGHKTLESLPNKEFLKNRINLVLSSKIHLRDGDNFIGNLDEINEEIKKYNTNNVIVIGGGSIYNQFIDRCDTIYVTTATGVYDADTYMKNLAFENFVFTEKIKCGEYKDGEYAINKWVTSEAEGYKAILWFNDTDNNTIFLYSNDFLNWKSVYSNNYFILTETFKRLLTQIYKNNNCDFLNLINVKQINTGTYRAEICFGISDTPRSFRPLIGNLRLAAFGNSMNNAIENIISTVLNIIKP